MSRSGGFDWTRKAVFFMTALDAMQLTALQANGEASFGGGSVALLLGSSCLG